MERLERISCHNFIEKKGSIFFSNWFYNGLFKVEYPTGKTTFVDFFHDEKVIERNIHVELFLRDNKIYFMPRRGAHIHIYDLSTGFIDSIEIRKKTEEFDVFIEVMLQENSLFLFPFKKKIPIKKLDLLTLKITDINEKVDFQGQYLSKKKEIFPAPKLLEKYNIKGKDFFSWKRMADGKWCGFMPMGSQMICYSEGTSKLEMVPLFLTNKEELKKYLYKLRYVLVKEGPVNETCTMDINEFEREFISKNISFYNSFKCSGNTGKKMWKMIKGN